MLRALVCIQDLGISQAEVARETGWSRSQINQTFRAGKLPSDAERFRAGIRKWAHGSERVCIWMDAHNLNPEALCDRIITDANLGTTLAELVARTHKNGPRTDDLLRLTRVMLYLLETVRGSVAPQELTRIEAEAAGML